MEQGCEFLRLPPPGTLAEALTSLMVLYSHVPSVTHFPVYIGRLDRMLEPFVRAVPRGEARGMLRLFLTALDRTVSDSFCHANIGPAATLTGELIVELLPELQNAVPNLTLCRDPAVTPDEFAVKCVSSALRCANPAFAYDPYFRARIGERYGPDEEANRLGLRIMEAIERQVNAFESKYCEVNGHRFLLHAQVGAAGDNGVTPGVRLAIGSEIPLYDHLRQAGMFHPFFPSGIGDIFPFDQTALKNPAAVLDIFKGAFQSGMHYLSTYEADSDVIRVTGYLLKRSDFEAMRKGAPVSNSAVAASRETIEERRTCDRMVRSV